MFRSSQKFRADLNPVRKVISLDETFDDINSGVTKSEAIDLVTALRQASIVLPVAFFEDFIRSLMLEFVDEINNTSPRIAWELLPEQLRKAHVFETHLIHRKKAPSGMSYSTYERNCILGLQMTLERLVSPLVSPDNYTVSDDAFSETNSNPSSETVNEMFNRIGVKNVFADTDLIVVWSGFSPIYTSRESITRELDEIVQLRHAVAHGRASALTVSRVQLVSNMVFLERLSESLTNLAWRWCSEVKVRR